MNSYGHGSFLVSLNGNEYRMPLCLADLGEGYSFSDIIDDTGECVRFLYYNNDFTGIEITVTHDGRSISDKKFDLIRATNFNIGENVSFSLNGIGMSSAYADIENVFGEPDEKNVYADETAYLYYYPDENISVRFSFTDNGLALISIGYGYH